MLPHLEVNQWMFTLQAQQINYPPLHFESPISLVLTAIIAARLATKLPQISKTVLAIRLCGERTSGEYDRLCLNFENLVHPRSLLLSRSRL